MSHFGLQTRQKKKKKNGKKKKKEKKRKKRVIKQRYGCMTLVLNCMEFWYDPCIQITWVWITRVSLDITLDPLSRVLLERPPNSRFKGSLVEKP